MKLWKSLLHILLVLVIASAIVSATYSLKSQEHPKSCICPLLIAKFVNSSEIKMPIAQLQSKVITSNDIRNIARLDNLDYKSAKVVKHELKINGQDVELLAVGIPLKDGKCAVIYYEFSKPVNNIKTVAYLFCLEGTKIRTEKMSINGVLRTLDTCEHECSSSSDCEGDQSYCVDYCCEIDWNDFIKCCGSCAIPCTSPGSLQCITCVFLYCPSCYYLSCTELGTICVEWDWGITP